MRWRHAGWAGLWIALILFSVPASAQSLARDVGATSTPDKRIALVIGNANYPTSPLKNPVNDARAIAEKLKALGFEVISKENVGLKEMARAATQFGEKLAGGGVGLFYYAGHGMQVKGRNYLIPVDAQITSESAVRSESIDVDQILEQLSGARLSMVILDACRNNPFERRFRGSGSGLAQIDAPKGSVIAYATAPGKVANDGDGANGLYTLELLRALDRTGLRVEDVFKQVRINVARATNDMQIPWEASSLTGDFYFAPQSQTAVAVKPPAPKPVSDKDEADLWSIVEKSNTLMDFHYYLSLYPNGEHAREVRSRVNNKWWPTSRQFREADKDGDVRITLDEWKTIKGSKMSFENMDTNKDGFVTPEEMNAYRKGP